MFKAIDRIHFIGIGGIGMSGLAEVLINLGYQVSGSDLKNSPIVERLRSLGVKIHSAHDAKNVSDVHVIVVSSAIPPRILKLRMHENSRFRSSTAPRCSPNS